MADPVILDIPHKLGRDAARAKLETGIGQIGGIVPGGALKEHRWEGDTLFFVIEAMGQRVGAKIDVGETRVHAEIDLPPVIALFADTIRAKFRKAGTKLLG